MPRRKAALAEAQRKIDMAEVCRLMEKRKSEERDYDVIDPDSKYKTDELVKLFNADTVKEVLKLGFEKKYGVPLYTEERLDD